MRKATATRRLMPSVLARRMFVDIGGTGSLVLVLLLFLYAAVDLVELNAVLGRSSAALIFSYLFKLPATAALLLPTAVALGVSIRFARLEQAGELTAMQAAGVSPRTIYRRMNLVSVCALPPAVLLVMWFGPMGIARFEDRIRQSTAVKSGGCSEGWTLQPFGFIRFDCDGQVETAMQIDSDGRPVARFVRSAGKTLSPSRSASWVVWNDAGWHVSAEGPAIDSRNTARPPPPPTANHLWGQSLPYAALDRAVSETVRLGISNSALRAERALRFAVVLAVVVIPGICAAFLFILDIRRTGRAVLAAIATTVFYWSVCAIAWNGTAAGLCHEAWLSIGAPLGVAAVSAIAAAAAHRKSHSATGRIEIGFAA